MLPVVGDIAEEVGFGSGAIIWTRLRIGQTRKVTVMGTATQNEGVAVGDRYYEVGHWEVIWVVKRIFVPNGEEISHVVLEREDAPGDFSVISLAVLSSREDYRADRRETHSVNVEDFRRRRDDQPRNPK